MEIDTVKPIQLEQHKTWKTAHQRLVAAKPRQIAIAQIEPVAERVPVFSVVPIDPTRELINFIIAAVGNVAGLAVNEILSGPPLAEITSARNLAMAICLWRLNLDVKTVAEYFEVREGSIKDARRTLDPILREHSISTKTPLELILPSVWAQWQVTTIAAPRVADIQEAVCEVWQVSKVDLFSMRRTHNLVQPRQAAFALAKKLTLRSLPDIGRRLGGRDHTTVLHAVRKYMPIMAIVSLKMLPQSTVIEWACAIKAELEITPLAKGLNRYCADRKGA